MSSGFASVYTEKVIKSARSQSSVKAKEQYSLAHMQCQLAVVSLFILGFYVLIKDAEIILKDVSLSFKPMTAQSEKIAVSIPFNIFTEKHLIYIFKFSYLSCSS